MEKAIKFATGNRVASTQHNMIGRIFHTYYLVKRFSHRVAVRWDQVDYPPERDFDFANAKDLILLK